MPAAAIKRRLATGQGNVKTGTTAPEPGCAVNSNGTLTIDGGSSGLVLTAQLRTWHAWANPGQAFLRDREGFMHLYDNYPSPG
jgi:hypothetical protein